MELLPHLFRTEYSKIVAVLCHSYGLDHIEIAEDIASETFLKAAEVWSSKGVPPNPTAWLYTVAKNQTKDYFRHKAIVDSKVKGMLESASPQTEAAIEFTDGLIADSQLAMIFAICHPDNAPQSQVCLALQILCGFSVEEIAGTFLTNTETIKKRLHRARTTLRNHQFQIPTLTETAIQSRLDTVLKTIYLLFNEGYFSRTGDQAIRKDLCSEAIRLTVLLAAHPLTNTPQVNALLALLYFQSSRLDARVDDHGEAILFEHQDRTRWDQALIDKGNHFLITACQGNQLSKYHLEAAIAYWHVTPTDTNKWQHILSLYDQLLLIDHSPMVALNRAFVVAQIRGHDKAIQEVEQLELQHNSFYHSLLGYLYAGTNITVAISHYNMAIALCKSSVEKQTLAKEIKLLQDKLAGSF
ncbi:RNA polymerase sigma factor [Chitinophaga ginsengisoli]|uniref:RNA polymerase sigma-70 factor (ECF subfamily) n=1 Tax=Chitinophaga ginsengisoli TaxID=363837 RepID=A0A2P8GLS3_9BACT|nr:sigma-70 family RNA polymerase sigma factor [Chitinophaga ginsengisoli]PSL34921.1 RNA polymerase sigma-70 factor (ECF subfamily) [Chitinophaga ginsengisoli]